MRRLEDLKENEMLSSSWSEDSSSVINASDPKDKDSDGDGDTNKCPLNR